MRLEPARFFATLGLLLASLPSFAEPRTPASDEAIVARLPLASDLRSLAPLRDAVRAHPEDPSRAIELARQYVTTGRQQDDPRLMGYALATVDPWLSRTAAVPEALTVAADAAQYLHRFELALEYLDRSLAIKPEAQAQLMRADLLEVRGDLAGARAACGHLAQLTAQEIAIVCLSSVASRSGELQHSFELLSRLRASAPLPPQIDIWVLGILAEMADRLGDGVAQGEFIRAAQRVAPKDLKLKATYADWLLSQGKADEAVRLLANDESHDGLLLRLALSAAAARSDPALTEQLGNAFRERQAFASGESRHLREEARFLLDFDKRPVEATQAALENWKIQREPEDLRLLVRAARQSGDGAALKVAQDWIAEHRYEDRRLP